METLMCTIIIICSLPCPWVASLPWGDEETWTCHIQAESLNAERGLTGTSYTYLPQEPCLPQTVASPSAWLPKWVHVDSLAN